MKSNSLAAHLLALPLAGLLATATAARAEQYALLVAIDDYSNVPGASNLPGCSHDLKSVREMLVKLGYPSANIVSLVDGQATKAGVMRGLDQLTAKAKAGDAVVFYYSGHGAQVPDMNDEDEPDNLDETLVTYDFDPRSKETWLLDDHLRASLSRLKTKRALVLIDACHSGTGTKADVINKKADFGFPKMFRPSAEKNEIDKNEIDKGDGAPSSHVLISGCAANEVSALGQFGGVQCSLFTKALITVVPKMQAASMEELQKAIYKEMETLAPKVAKEQHPQLEGKFNGTFAAITGASPAAAEEGEQNNQPPQQQPSDGLPSAFPVRVATDKRDYMPGDEMVASVVSDRAGYLRLYYVDNAGDAYLIFPNRFQQDNRVAARQRIDVGASEDFKFSMKPPGGTEMLLAAVSETQFTDHDALDFTKSAIKKMGKIGSVRKLLDSGTKEIEVIGGGAPRPAQIGRSASFYEIHEASKDADAIVKQIEVEGRADFSEDALPFKLDSTELASEAAQRQLVQIAAALRSPQLAKAKFVIEGHTCDLGEADYNKSLSERRARAISDLLKTAGVGSERLSIVGLGESKPAQAGTSETSRAKNRRVELKLVK